MRNSDDRKNTLQESREPISRDQDETKGQGYCIITMKEDDLVTLNNHIKIIVRPHGKQVKLGISAPKNYRIEHISNDRKRIKPV